MKEGPDIAQLGALIGDPARANILTALMSGKALTATELAAEAGVTVQTTSSHLKKLETAGLLRRRKQGRHRYFALADDDVGAVLEAMMGLAAKRGLLRARTGPKDADLRHARVCYNHLAGDLGVTVYDGLIAQGYLSEQNNDLSVTDAGRRFFAEFGIDIDGLRHPRRALCKSCLDWSARRSHLAGSLGAAVLDQIYARGWATRTKGTRIVRFSTKGQQNLLLKFAPPR